MRVTQYYIFNEVEYIEKNEFTIKISNDNDVDQITFNVNNFLIYSVDEENIELDASKSNF